jgi:hypothetical protein
VETEVTSARYVAEAVNLRLPTVAARVRFQFRSYGICSEQIGSWASFLQVHRFPLPITQPSAPHSSLSIIRTDTTGHIGADKRSVLSLTPPTEEYKPQFVLKIICRPIVVSSNRHIFRTTAIPIQFTCPNLIQDLH